LREYQSRGDLLRAFYYTATIEDQEFFSIRPLSDWLDLDVRFTPESGHLICRAFRCLLIAVKPRAQGHLLSEPWQQFISRSASGVIWQARWRLKASYTGAPIMRA